MIITLGRNLFFFSVQQLFLEQFAPFVPHNINCNYYLVLVMVLKEIHTIVLSFIKRIKSGFCKIFIQWDHFISIFTNHLMINIICD